MDLLPDAICKDVPKVPAVRATDGPFDTMRAPQRDHDIVWGSEGFTQGPKLFALGPSGIIDVKNGRNAPVMLFPGAALSLIHI